MDNIATLLMEDTHTHVVDLLRVSAGIRRKIVALLGELTDSLDSRIRDAEGRSGVTMARLRALQQQAQETIATAYRKIARGHIDDLRGIVEASAQNTIESVNSIIGVPVFTVAFTEGQLENLVRTTYLNGAFAKDWWAKQGADLTHRFGLQMRIGLLAGDDIDNMVRRVRGTRAAGYTDGLMSLPTKQAEALVRTSVVAAGNRGTLETFIQNRDVVKGVQWVSTLDNRTTEICIALDGLMWELPEEDDANDYGGYKPIGHNKDFPGPTGHWNCRSTQISVLKSYEELAGRGGVISKRKAAKIDEGTRTSMDGKVGVDKGFKGWLAGKSETFQDDLLGKTAAGLWRQGKLSLRDLTDQSNRPLTVTELQAKIKRRGAIAPKP